MVAPLALNVVPSMITQRCRASDPAMIMAQALSTIIHHPLPVNVMITNARWRYVICQFHLVALALADQAAHMFTRATRAVVLAMCTRTTLVTLRVLMVTRITQAVVMVGAVGATMIPTAATPPITDVVVLTICLSKPKSLVLN